MPVVTRRPKATQRKKRTGALARLEARIPHDLKVLIETAAPLAGHSSVTDYLVQALRESASRTIEESRHSRLEADQAAAFVRSLLDPAAPTSTLRAAFALHRAQVRG